MAGCPWFSTGQKPCGAWPRKYATAISPARMKATGRVNSPTRSNRPPKVSSVPAIPGSDMIGAVTPPGMMAAGNAKILAVPNCMKRKAAAIPQHRRGEPLDGAVLVQQPGRGDRADPRDARISVGRVAHESQEVGNQRGLDAELLAHPGRVADLPALAIDLDDAIAADALR